MVVNGQDARCPSAWALEAGFVRPPDSARPHVYYMIMNGNMSKACITADFEAMAKTGIGGVLDMLDSPLFAAPVLYLYVERFF